ncbi:hypothetical protein FGO68_gene4880 [Halteria grandinella]|uniref:Uncharacterized protein n=1 Tax=Halteria grandinella TaxID=5974 RepID=A0A8J8SXQ0_HALGN|nr:hypothetical protein FGO68_gene4880 [Halteria grandinella]
MCQLYSNSLSNHSSNSLLMHFHSLQKWLQILYLRSRTESIESKITFFIVNRLRTGKLMRNLAPILFLTVALTEHGLSTSQPIGLNWHKRLFVSLQYCKRIILVNQIVILMQGIYSLEIIRSYIMIQRWIQPDNDMLSLDIPVESVGILECTEYIDKCSSIPTICSISCPANYCKSLSWQNDESIIRDAKTSLQKSVFKLKFVALDAVNAAFFSCKPSIIAGVIRNSEALWEVIAKRSCYQSDQLTLLKILLFFLSVFKTWARSCSKSLRDTFFYIYLHKRCSPIYRVGILSQFAR